MDQKLIDKAAQIIWECWNTGKTISDLPKDCKPKNKNTAYEIQKRVIEISQSKQIGWKIAATSENGQNHIGVSGPLAGRLLDHRSRVTGDNLTLGPNIMRVAEAEFCFKLGDDLPIKKSAYTVDEVLSAVDTLHPAIEIPDSRYRNFEAAGEVQLIADNACASWFILGEKTTADWRSIDLREHQVDASVNGVVKEKGVGKNVLGDPRLALTWIANELSREKIGLKVGEIITTGTCVSPFCIKPGDFIDLDFGQIGEVSVTLT